MTKIIFFCAAILTTATAFGADQAKINKESDKVDISTAAAMGADAATLHTRDRCGKNSDENDKELKYFLRDLNKFSLLLPNIPPEEEVYLAAEYAEVLKEAQDQLKIDRQLIGKPRMQILMERRLYFVWKLRTEVEKMKKLLALVLEPKYPVLSFYKNEDANKLDRSLSVTAEIPYLVEVLNDLTKSEDRRADTFVTMDLTTYSMGLRFTHPLGMELYQRCKLAELSLPLRH